MVVVVVVRSIVLGVSGNSVQCGVVEPEIGYTVLLFVHGHTCRRWVVVKSLRQRTYGRVLYMSYVCRQKGREVEYFKQAFANFGSMCVL